MTEDQLSHLRCSKLHWLNILVQQQHICLLSAEPSHKSLNVSSQVQLIVINWTFSAVKQVLTYG